MNFGYYICVENDSPNYSTFSFSIRSQKGSRENSYAPCLPSSYSSCFCNREHVAYFPYKREKNQHEGRFDHRTGETAVVFSMFFLLAAWNKFSMR